MRRGFFLHGTLFVVLFAILVAGVLGGCADEQSSERISETRLLLDTYCAITIHGDVDYGLINEAFSLCEEYEALFSITTEGSDVWRVNHAGGEPVQVDPRTIEVIRGGLEFGELSDGMFDITIGRLSRLWYFDCLNKNHELPCSARALTCDFCRLGPVVPDEAEIEAVRATVDYRQVSIVGDSVQLTDPGAWIDLGAIAKGYIADKIAEYLIEQGVSGALIDLGGDIVTVGNRQDGTPWRIALREPLGDADEYLGVIELTGAAVISSGIYERQFEIDGVRYHHILDPNTGMPAVSDVVSATVVADSAMIGEGLSTIAVLMGSERVQGMFGQASGFIGAVLVLVNGDILELGDVRLVN